MPSLTILGSVTFKASADGRLLEFTDAILARVEINGNRDDVDLPGLQEVAATIDNMPLNIEHHGTQNVGYFASGHVKNDELIVSGALWIHALEAQGVDPQAILDGKWHLSIEAEAAKAKCSVCANVYTEVEQYCVHLQNRARFSAVRHLSELRGLGGAITKNPAGSDTTFNTSTMRVVARHEESTDTSNTNSERGVHMSEVDLIALAASVKTVLEQNGTIMTWMATQKDKEEEDEIEAAKHDEDELKASLDKLTSRVSELEASEVTLTAERDKLKTKVDTFEAAEAKQTESTLKAQLIEAELVTDEGWDGEKDEWLKLTPFAIKRLLTVEEDESDPNPKKTDPLKISASSGSDSKDKKRLTL